MIRRYQYDHITWVDIILPDAAEARAIMQEFSIDAAVAEEIIAPSPKPRIDLYPTFLYLILHFPAIRHSHSRDSAQEVDFIVSKNVLITVRYDTIDAIDEFAKEFEVNTILKKSAIGEHAGFLFYLLVSKLYRALLRELENMESALNAIEGRIFGGDERAMVEELSLASREIIDFRRAVSYHDEILETLRAAGVLFFGKQFAYYLRSIKGEYRRVWDALEGKREYLQELRDTNDSILSAKQNEVMKTFTILAFVTFPLALIAEIFGFSPLATHPYAFYYIAGVILIGIVIMTFYFKHKRWL